ncbi:hypothetical protein C2S52_004392 [Perilla frutescens var. hirtella]|nr:hypothetical protein C2S52_004392 [Perilla frutescens var. hirtella]
MVLLLGMVAMLWNGGEAQSSSSSGCTVALMSLSPCINYVTGNSSSPSQSCCSSLSSVVGSQPQCLCSLIKGGGASNLGIDVNQTLALALPQACSVQTPPLSRCDAGVSGPTSAPAPAAGSPADETPDEAPTTPSSVPADDIPSGSKTVPRTEGSSNSGSKAGAALSQLVVVGSIVLMAFSSTSPFS